MILRRALSTAAASSTTTTAKNSIYDAKHIQQELLKSYNRKTANLLLAVNSQPLAERVVRAIGDHQRRLLGGGSGSGSEIESPENQQKRFIFEASPGNGVLTEQLLLQLQNHRIRVFEHNANRLVALRALQKRFGEDRLEIVDKQILDFCNGNYKLLNLTRDDLSKVCFDGVPLHANWSNGSSSSGSASSDDGKNSTAPVDSNSPSSPSITFLTVLSPFLAREFLSYLVYSLTHFDSLFSTGPTQFYLFVPLPAYKAMVSRPTRNLKHYTAFTINVNSLFEYAEVEELQESLEGGTEDSSPGLPGVGQVKVEGRTVTVVPSDYFALTSERQKLKTKEDFVLLHVRPKALVHQLEADFLINYVTFVKQSFTKRSNYAIRYYEKQFPGCAVELIGLGISYFKTLGDLTAEEMFTIFSHLYRTPHYQTSIFRELC